MLCVEKANRKMLHTKAFHLHSILEVAKVYRWGLPWWRSG